MPRKYFENIYLTLSSSPVFPLSPARSVSCSLYSRSCMAGCMDTVCLGRVSSTLHSWLLTFIDPRAAPPDQFFLLFSFPSYGYRIYYYTTYVGIYSNTEGIERSDSLSFSLSFKPVPSELDVPPIITHPSNQAQAVAAAQNISS